MTQLEYFAEIIEKERLEELVYFCSPNGECVPRSVAVDQLKALNEILNNRGQEGWTLSQMIFGTRGILLVWMRKKKRKEKK